MKFHKNKITRNYMKKNILDNLFQTSLFFTLILSFFIFVKTVILRNGEHRTFTTWQFPMLLAIFLDSIYS